MSKITIDEKRTLADLLALPAGNELDAAVANALGDDLKARDEDLQDVLDENWRSFEELVPEQDFVAYQSAPFTDENFVSCGLWLWQTREGKPYAAALEAAVAGYRRPAPKYSTDGNAMLDLIATMRERGFKFLVGCGSPTNTKGHLFKVEFRGPHDLADVVLGKFFPIWYEPTETLPHAVARAAITALQYGSEP